MKKSNVLTVEKTQKLTEIAKTIEMFTASLVTHMAYIIQAMRNNIESNGAPYTMANYHRLHRAVRENADGIICGYTIGITVSGYCRNILIEKLFNLATEYAKNPDLWFRTRITLREDYWITDLRIFIYGLYRDKMLDIVKNDVMMNYTTVYDMCHDLIPDFYNNICNEIECY